MNPEDITAGLLAMGWVDAGEPDYYFHELSHWLCLGHPLWRLGGRWFEQVSYDLQAGCRPRHVRDSRRMRLAWLTSHEVRALAVTELAALELGLDLECDVMLGHVEGIVLDTVNTQREKLDQSPWTAGDLTVRINTAKQEHAQIRRARSLARWLRKVARPASTPHGAGDTRR